MNLTPRHCLCAAVLLLVGMLVESGPAQYLEAVVPVGWMPTDVLWNPTSNKVYTSNNQSGSVTVIDGASNQVLATVAVADYPVSLCWNSVNNKVYATCADPDWLYVIDGAGDTLLRRVRMRGYPTRMAYNARMNKLYVICYDDQMVRVYDGSADTLVAEVWLGPSGWAPCQILWHPVSNRVFCSLYSVDSLKVIECTTDRVVSQLRPGHLPYALCWNPVNNLVYVAAYDTTCALSQGGDSIVATMPIYATWSLCFVPFPNKLYGTNGYTFIVDCRTHAVVATLALGGDNLICDTLAGKVYCVNGQTDFLHVYDARGDTVLTSIYLGPNPEAMAWNPLNHRVYVADLRNDRVWVIKDTSVGVAEPGPGPERPAQILLGSLGHRINLHGRGDAALIDICGRRVAILKPGPNYVSHIPPGVYFAHRDGHAGAAKVIVGP